MRRIENQVLRFSLISFFITPDMANRVYFTSSSILLLSVLPQTLALGCTPTDIALLFFGLMAASFFIALCVFSFGAILFYQVLKKKRIIFWEKNKDEVYEHSAIRLKNVNKAYTKV